VESLGPLPMSITGAAAPMPLRAPISDDSLA
jgi:hypothetical protein